jgi:hypothetical protein
MGSGEFIPNGSIHWIIEEEDVTNNGGAVTRKKSRDVRGRDPIRNDLIGKGKAGGKNHDETLLVTLRFLSEDEAVKALQAAVDTIKRNATSNLFEAEVRISVSPTSTTNAGRPAPNDYAQARVEW